MAVARSCRAHPLISETNFRPAALAFSKGPGGSLFRQQLSGFSGLHAVGHVEEYLPYSPDSNPIENAFAKLKALLRKASARTVPDLWAAIADALPQFTPAECANYFTACGYEPE